MDIIDTRLLLCQEHESCKKYLKKKKEEYDKKERKNVRKNQF